MTTEIKFTPIPYIQPKDIEKVFDNNGELTGLIQRRTITKAEAEELWPPTPPEENE